MVVELRARELFEVFSAAPSRRSGSFWIGTVGIHSGDSGAHGSGRVNPRINALARPCDGRGRLKQPQQRAP